MRGRVSTNGLENFWSLLKRCLNGTWVSVEPFHLHRYLDEQAWRYNQRKLTNAERFVSAVFGIFGKRLTYTTSCGGGWLHTGKVRGAFGGRTGVRSRISA